jgi:hypothetical protein
MPDRRTSNRYNHISKAFFRVDQFKNLCCIRNNDSDSTESESESTSDNSEDEYVEIGQSDKKPKSVAARTTKTSKKNELSNKNKKEDKKKKKKKKKNKKKDEKKNEKKKISKKNVTKQPTLSLSTWEAASPVPINMETNGSVLAIEGIFNLQFVSLFSLSLSLSLLLLLKEKLIKLFSFRGL